MKRNQRECVQFFEKFRYFVNLSVFLFALNLNFVFVFLSAFVIVEKINIININIDFVKKLFFDEIFFLKLLRYLSPPFKFQKKNESKKSKNNEKNFEQIK